MLGQLRRLTGEDAWAYAQATGALLNSYGGHVYSMRERTDGCWVDCAVWEEPRQGLSLIDAYEIYIEDPGWLWIDVPMEVCA
jgi:hypothetical protein